MSSVTGRIGEITQPKGGYIKPSLFTAVPMDESYGTLAPDENLHGSIIGMVVDYMTRFMMGAPVQEAFKISLHGAQLAERLGVANSMQIAYNFATHINGLDPASITSACKLVTFDVWYRNPVGAMMAKNYKDTNPDEPTIVNIQILIQRSLNFFQKYGPITKDGFTFEPPIQNDNAYADMIKTGRGSYGGYTAVVETGDGDFLTKDTLWDFKVSKSKPTSKHTLQLLMYYIMGKHSGQAIYSPISRLGIFNPRLA